MNRFRPLRRLLLGVSLAAFAFACTEDPADPVQPVPDETDEPLVLSVGEVQLEPQGITAPAPGSILVYVDGSAAGTELLRGRDGTYSGTLMKGSASGKGLTVLSPGASGIRLKDGEAVFTFPAVQTISGSIDESLAFAAGKSAPGEASVALEPLFSGLLLRPARDDVFAVTIKGNGGEILCGTAFGALASGALRFDASGGRELKAQTAIGVMDAGGLWPVVLPPVRFPEGLSLVVEATEGVYEVSLPSPLTLERGRFEVLDIPDSLPDPGPDPVIVPELQTGLRTLYITTPTGGGIYSKDEWTTGCSVLLVDDAGKEYYRSDEVGVKGRGNMTWTFSKKPYTLKLPSKADLIGTGAAGKRWVLLANWMDRTLLRNDVAFEAARRTGLEWTPSGEFVELYLNGKHLGNYWLGEMIKVGKGRLSADYLIEMDTYYDAQWRFYSTYGRRVNEWKTGMPIGVKHPDDDELTGEQFSEIKDLVAAVERAVYLGEGDFHPLMNLESFADWYLVHELTQNLEPNHPKSCYFYFRGGVMYAGPVWDFDWETFVLYNNEGLQIRYSIYFEQLLKDPQFVSLLKSRWASLKPSFQTLPQYIDERAAAISSSESINWSMWPCTGYNVNGDAWLSFQGAVSRMKSALSYRILAIDKALSVL